MIYKKLGITDLNVSIEKLKENLGNNIDMAKWSIAWCLKNKHINSMLVGCKTVEQISSIIGALEIYGEIN